MSVRSFLLGWLRPSRQRISPICSESVFRAVVEREQMRCTRTGGMFVIVVTSAGRTTSSHGCRRVCRQPIGHDASRDVPHWGGTGCQGNMATVGQHAVSRIRCVPFPRNGSRRSSLSIGNRQSLDEPNSRCEPFRASIRGTAPSPMEESVRYRFSNSRADTC
jgi:hypothetical protein